MFNLRSKFETKHQILEQGFELYKQSFWATLPYSFIATLLIFGPHLFGAFQPSNIKSLEDHGGFLALMGFCWLTAYILLSALIFRIYCICYHVPSSFLTALRHAIYKLISLLMLAAMYALIVLSGTMLLIVPGLILSVSLMFSFILMITGNQNVLQTLTMSHRLVWGHWWHTVTVISIPFLIDITLSLAAFVIIVGLLINLGISFHNLTLYLFFAHIIIQALFIPLMFSVALVLLHDLRQRIHHTF